MILPLLFALQAATAPNSASASPPAPTQSGAFRAKLRAMGVPDGMMERETDDASIGEVTLAPLFHDVFMCSEHPLGQLHGTGDAVGTDCMIVGGVEGAQGYERPFRTDGRSNADWYGWRAEVHAPFDGVVTAVLINPGINTPGTMGKPPASGIVFQRADGTDVIYGHIMDPRVKVGDRVVAGQVVAIDGNNGMARNPHIHVGAWRGKQALQIRWDLRAMGQVPALVGN